MLDITVQVFAGGYKSAPADFGRVREKLEDVLNRIPATRVIMGWTPAPELYGRVRDFLRQRGVEFFLWLPVFSETGRMKPCVPVTDWAGGTAAGNADGAEEDFAFLCPNEPQNVRAALSVFNENFANIGFDGVFLDRIRYPSFAAGADAGFGCFCPRCREAYTRAGADTTALMRGQGRIFDDPAWRDFLKIKAQSVTESVGALCGELRNRGFKIGLDVFAPFLSRFVGQDIPALSRLADFVKPMMYRKTFAPAGIPFEWDALKLRTGISPPFAPDLDFCAGDLAELVKSADCPVYAGVEWNRVPGIARPTPGYIHESLGAYAAAGARGFVLSWNALDAPLENTAAAAQWLNHRAGR
ncbi:MAG: hypothetical protein LBR85_02695 [Oscillospiraceae bacterium]|jgi:hypothetical protein|nr:hypothetical protein [Oscillospiraceae bacterium]